MADGPATAPVRAVIYGVGEMGSLFTRLLLDKQVEIVGAVARGPAKVGRDLGGVAHLGRDLGIEVTDDAAALLASCEADIAIVAAASYLEEMAPSFRVCLANGVNVLTLEEETFYPWRRQPALAEELDSLARENGVTLAASGVQDVNWTLAVGAMMATAHRIDRVRGRSSWRADDYGPAVADYMFLGSDQEAAVAAAEVEEVTCQTSLEALAALAGLTPTTLEADVAVLVAEEDIRCERLGMTIARGAVRGLAQTVRMSTSQGIDLELEMAGFVHAPGEVCVNEWRVEGEPDIHVHYEDFQGRLVTCTVLVNRIPDILAAAPGLATVDQLPFPRYRPDLLRPAIGES